MNILKKVIEYFSANPCGDGGDTRGFHRGNTCASGGRPHDARRAGLLYHVEKSQPIKMSELRRRLGHPDLTPDNPVHAMVADLVKSGEITLSVVDGEPAASLGAKASPPAPGEFPTAFRKAFDAIDSRNGRTNFVKLHALRGALGVGRKEFDAGLRKLRSAGEFTMDSHEGLHGSLTPEEREAGIEEAGSKFIYVSRRSESFSMLRLVEHFAQDPCGDGGPVHGFHEGNTCQKGGSGGTKEPNLVHQMAAFANKAKKGSGASLKKTAGGKFKLVPKKKGPTLGDKAKDWGYSGEGINNLIETVGSIMASGSKKEKAAKIAALGMSDATFIANNFAEFADATGSNSDDLMEVGKAASRIIMGVDGKGNPLPQTPPPKAAPDKAPWKIMDELYGKFEDAKEAGKINKFGSSFSHLESQIKASMTSSPDGKPWPDKPFDAKVDALAQHLSDKDGKLSDFVLEHADEFGHGLGFDPVEFRQAASEANSKIHHKLGTSKKAAEEAKAKEAAGLYDPRNHQSIYQWGDKHFKRWANSLKDDEDEAIGAYANTGYRAINGYLRGSFNPELSKIPAEKVREYAELLNRALYRGKAPHDMDVVRGLKGGPEILGLDPDQILPGTTIRDPAFVSTTLRDTPPDVATPEHGEDFIHMKITLPKGTPGAYLPAAASRNGDILSNEQEFLLPAGSTHFRITKYERDPSNPRKHVIHAVAVPNKDRTLKFPEPSQFADRPRTPEEDEGAGHDAKWGSGDDDEDFTYKPEKTKGSKKGSKKPKKSVPSESEMDAEYASEMQAMNEAIKGANP